jgi:hypothetical protein
MGSATNHENDWVLAPELHDMEVPVSGFRRCCLVVEGVAIHCRVVDVPRVGDRIRSSRPLTIESVRIGGDGMVRLDAAPGDAVRG